MLRRICASGFLACLSRDLVYCLPFSKDMTENVAVAKKEQERRWKRVKNSTFQEPGRSPDKLPCAMSVGDVNRSSSSQLLPLQRAGMMSCSNAAQLPLQAPLQTVPGLCPPAAPCGGTRGLSFDRLLLREEFTETMSWWHSDQTSPHFFLKQASLFVGISLSTKQSGACGAELGPEQSGCC